jgi:hypothetical protein
LPEGRDTADVQAANALSDARAGCL